MLYFILENNHKIELTHKKVTFIEKNPWFENEFNSEYSFPFEMHELEFSKITDFAHYNAVAAKTQFKGKLYKDGQLTDATLKIQQQKGKLITGIIYSGLEAFPNFDKQLNELPLDKFDVTNLKTHAQETIMQSYPAVSHNFGMVHTDKYDPTSDEFNGFEKIINNHSGGEFVKSVLLAETNVDVIKNIMQPLPYLMHVVQAGFQDTGYTLEGDILNIDDLNKALIFRDGEYYESTLRENIPFKFLNTEWTGEAPPHNNIQHVTFFKQFVVPKKGDYLIFGNLMCVLYEALNGNGVSDIIITISKYSGGVSTILYDYDVIHVIQPHTNIRLVNREIEIPVSFNAGDIFTVIKTEAKRDLIPSPTPDYPDAINLEIIPIRYRNPDGTPIISVLDLNEVDLTRVVPDMSFGDLIKIIQAWKNLDFKPSENVVRMDFIQPQLSRSNAKNLSEFDIEEPLRTFLDERSYELGFTDGKTHETYKYDSMFITRDAVLTNEYHVNKNTTEIKIDALPYPVIARNNITTAFAFDNEQSKLRLVFFRPVVGQAAPFCFENLNMLIPAIYASDYILWIRFLVNSISYNWDFLISVEKFKDIMINSIIYCYGNYHIFSETEKERINQLYWRVTAKSESLI